MTEMLFIAAMALIMGVAFILTQAHEASQRARMKRLAHSEGAPSAVVVPKVVREPDPRRSRRALDEALVLLMSAKGAFDTPLAPAESKNEARTLDTDVLDAVQHTRDALALLREAAEHDPGVESLFATQGFDPWTEHVALDTIHVRLSGAGRAFAEASRFAASGATATRAAIVVMNEASA
jgi:hypothetical protein